MPAGTRRQFFTAAAGAAVAVMAACSSDEPEVPRPDDAPTGAPPTGAGEPVEVAVSSCPGAHAARFGQVQGDASPPRCDDGTWVFDLPATEHPAERRRSEIWLNRPGGAYRSGDAAEIRLMLWASLGAAASTSGDWHVLWQLHGPTDGVWKGPAIALQVRQGGWFISGGTGDRAHGVGGRSTMWEHRLGAYADERWHSFTIAARLSHEPGQGFVAARLGDASFTGDYYPRTPQGLAMTTLPPGQAEVHPRIGLYRGTGGGAPAPVYNQRVRAAVTRLS